MILVAGAGGHVGREIVKKAVDRNIKVRCFDNAVFDSGEANLDGLEIVSGDITCLEDVKKAVQGVDTVMFVLGLKRQTKELTHEMVEHGGDSDLTAAEFLPVHRDLPSLRAAAQACEGCSLHDGATQTVFGEGPADAELVLVGEQPGDEEDRVGRPFVGPAGRLLDEILKAAEIARDRVYLTNVVKHFSYVDRGKRRLHKTPCRIEVISCRAWLEKADEAEVVWLPLGYFFGFGAQLDWGSAGFEWLVVAGPGFAHETE